jgi:hypothetical protein
MGNNNNKLIIRIYTKIIIYRKCRVLKIICKFKDKSWLNKIKSKFKVKVKIIIKFQDTEIIQKK